ncbi:MAG: ABC transporter substrate-binding protein [Candidatus Saccharibacteria bacterium]|nr:ABC transporter substrate-binding protein [Rhodoferax sp.]
MKRSFLRQFLAVVMVVGGAVVAPLAHAQDEAPDVLIKRISVDVLDSVKSDKSVRSGDLTKLIALVDARVMPNVNFQRMTASAVGPAWRQATPEQQKRLQEEFKVLLVRSYAGAVGQVTDQSIVMKPLRIAPEDKEVMVRTEIKGKGDVIQLDYRLEKTPGQGAGWKIYNINVLGVWLVETYKTQFAQEINAKGLDGLITSLSERNKANAKKA